MRHQVIKTIDHLKTVTPTPYPLTWGHKQCFPVKNGGGGCLVALIYRVRMPDGVAARTDGVDIYVDDRLDDIQLKCAIAHEEIHIERGHSTVQPEAEEFAVRYEVARRLLPLDEIVGVCKDAKSLKMIARELGVTRQVLMDRAATLTEPQMQIAGCFTCRKCPIVNARYPEAREVQMRRVAYAN